MIALVFIAVFSFFRYLNNKDSPAGVGFLTGIHFIFIPIAYTFKFLRDYEPDPLLTSKYITIFFVIMGIGLVVWMISLMLYTYKNRNNRFCIYAVIIAMNMMFGPLYFFDSPDLILYYTHVLNSASTFASMKVLYKN